MGDRSVEIGIVARQGKQEGGRLSQLVNPERTTPADAHSIHGISDQGVAESPCFGSVAPEVGAAVQDAWIVGNNVRLDVGLVAFVATEMASAAPTK